MHEIGVHGSKVMCAAAAAAFGPEHALAKHQQQQRLAAAARASRFLHSGSTLGDAAVPCWTSPKRVHAQRAQFCGASLLHELIPTSARPGRRRHRFTQQEADSRSSAEDLDAQRLAQRLDAAYLRALATTKRNEASSQALKQARDAGLLASTLLERLGLSELTPCSTTRSSSPLLTRRRRSDPAGLAEPLAPCSMPRPLSPLLAHLHRAKSYRQQELQTAGNAGRGHGLACSSSVLPCLAPAQLGRSASCSATGSGRASAAVCTA